MEKLDTNSHLMARVRPYKESDLAKLQELFHKNHPELVTPEFTHQDQMSLVLEDERGQVKMAIMGNPAAIDRGPESLARIRPKRGSGLVAGPDHRAEGSTGTGTSYNCARPKKELNPRTRTMKERKPVIPHGKEVVRGKHKIVVWFETKRAYRTPPAKRKIAAQRMRAETKKMETARTLKEAKLHCYKALRFLNDCVPQVRICKGRG